LEKDKTITGVNPNLFRDHEETKKNCSCHPDERIQLYTSCSASWMNRLSLIYGLITDLASDCGRNMRNIPPISMFWQVYAILSFCLPKYSRFAPHMLAGTGLLNRAGYNRRKILYAVLNWAFNKVAIFEKKPPVYID
jgi:hypothetical protein